MSEWAEERGVYYIILPTTKHSLESGLPRVGRGNNEDGGRSGLRRLVGGFGRLHLLHLLLKAVQLPPQPGDGTILGQVVLCAVTALTWRTRWIRTTYWI